MSIGFRIVAPHFVAGGSIDQGKVIEVAPIIKYMVGWSPQKAKDYCDKKGWTIKRL